MGFRETNIRDIKTSAVELISDRWMLVTAGNETSFNTMTASWGGVGELWKKDVVFTFIRPQRYTFEFMEKSDYFTLCFFDGYKKELALCGAKSGREIDKVKECGFTPVSDSGVYFKEASLVLICKKLAYQDMDPKGFLDPSIMDNYAEGDFHRTYVGEILKVLVKE